jgi:hypothetical protein
MATQIKLNGTIQRETEKAINVELVWEHPDTMARKTFMAWLPKSQVKVYGNTFEAPKWLGDKIGDEIRSVFHLCKHLGGKGLVY